MAFGRFDPASPHDSRFVDEDFNRVWEIGRLEGGDDSAELRRARELRATFDAVDRLLDIHSMGTESRPLILCHGLDKERRLARAVGYPGEVVCGSGHVEGRRLIEYAPFNDPARDKVALLVECGFHWGEAASTVALDTAAHFLRGTGAVGEDTFRDLVTEAAPPPQRFLEVTGGVAAKTDTVRFHRALHGVRGLPRSGHRHRPRRRRGRRHAPRRLRADQAQPPGRQGPAGVAFRPDIGLTPARLLAAAGSPYSARPVRISRSMTSARAGRS